MGVDVVLLHRHAAMRVYVHIIRRVNKSKLARDTVFPELSVSVEGRPPKCLYPTMTGTEYGGSVLHQNFF
jgi:hypothetical protein